MPSVRLTEDYLIKHMRQTKPLSDFWRLDLDEKPVPAPVVALPAPAQAKREKRKCCLYELDGVSKPVAAWAAEYGVCAGSLRRRLNSGMALHDALSATKAGRSQLYYVGDLGRTIKEWSKLFGVRTSAIYSRLKYGWSIEAAVSLPASVVRGGKAHDGGWQEALAAASRTSGGTSRDTEPKQEFFQEAAE